MATSIKEKLSVIQDKRHQKEMFDLLNAALTDVTALRTAFVALTAKLDVATAKLNADAGVTDANYAVDFASTLDPAALTLTT